MFISDTGRHPYFPVSEKSEVLVADGDHIGLKCVPEGNPKPQVTWHLPGNLTRNVSCFFVKSPEMVRRHAMRKNPYQIMSVLTTRVAGVSFLSFVL